MANNGVPRSDSDFYAVSQLFAFQHIRNPLQFQHFGGSPETFRQRFIDMFTKLLHNS